MSAKDIPTKRYDRKWELETAENCELPKLIPDICDRCRDYAYCHKQTQLSFDLFGDEKGERECSTKK